MGWVSISAHRRVYMAKFRNKLVNMDNSRLTKGIFYGTIGCYILIFSSDNHTISTFSLTYKNATPIHFVFSCSRYDELRTNVFGILNGIRHLSTQNQLVHSAKSQKKT